MSKFIFSEYLKTLDNNENYMKLSDNIIETLVNPSIKYSKRLRNRELFFIEYNMDSIAGPGLICKNILESINVNRNNGMIFLPINLFKVYQIKDDETINSLRTIEESKIIFDTESYIVLNPERLISFANQSKFNKIRTISKLKTYNDLINLLEVYKKYFEYKQ
jgi:hypothetical protein